eukprot:310616_1
MKLCSSLIVLVCALLASGKATWGRHTRNGARLGLSGAKAFSFARGSEFAELEHRKKGGHGSGRGPRSRSKSSGSESGSESGSDSKSDRKSNGKKHCTGLGSCSNPIAVSSELFDADSSEKTSHSWGALQKGEPNCFKFDLPSNVFPLGTEIDVLLRLSQYGSRGTNTTGLTCDDYENVTFYKSVRDEITLDNRECDGSSLSVFELNVFDLEGGPLTVCFGTLGDSQADLLDFFGGISVAP